MRFLVLGAGAVGGYFGGRLAAAGRDVRFLVRPERAKRLSAGGLRIVSPEGDLAIAPQLVIAGDQASIAAPADAILLGCKSYDLDAAVAALRPYVGPDTMIVPLLNGLRHLVALDAAFGEHCVLGGLCQISATLDDGGTIRHLGLAARLPFGERAGGLSPRVGRLAAAMNDAGFQAPASAEIMQDMWEKFTILASLAGATCLMRAPIGPIVGAGGTGFMQTLIAECIATATAAGFRPRPEFHDRIERLTDPQSTLAASMLRDIERGGPSEGDHVLGDLARRAASLDVATPVLDMAALHLAVYERCRLASDAGTKAP
ncbi:MAG: ketopantoate reductase family protein [Dongiaceae bacterium]